MKFFPREFLGTFLLALTFTGAVEMEVGAAGPWIIAGVWWIIIGLMPGKGWVHCNPAITLALGLTRHLPRSLITTYWLAQGLGASTAAVALMYWKGLLLEGGMLIDFSRAVTAEYLLTLALILSIFGALSLRSRIPRFLTAGFTAVVLYFGIILAGPVSGGVLNPALGSTLFLVRRLNLQVFLIYVVAQFAAAFTAVLILRFTGTRSDPLTDRPILPPLKEAAAEGD